jgi:hypothetical protein
MDKQKDLVFPKFTSFFKEEEDNNDDEQLEDKDDKEIKIIPRIKKFKSRNNIIKWLNHVVYDDYTRYYFIKEMFNKLLVLMNNNGFYSDTNKDKIFTEFVNWCYFNSYDFLIS